MSYPFHVVLTSLQGNWMLRLLPGEGGKWKAEGEQQGAQGHQTVADAVELVGSTKPAQSSQTGGKVGLSLSLAPLTQTRKLRPEMSLAMPEGNNWKAVVLGSGPRLSNAAALLLTAWQYFQPDLHEGERRTSGLRGGELGPFAAGSLQSLPKGRAPQQRR